MTSVPTPASSGPDSHAVCPVCATPVSAGMPYCPACGTRIGGEPARTCPKCGHPAGVASKFCASCGYGMDSGARSRLRTSAHQLVDPGRVIDLVQIDESGSEVSRRRVTTNRTTLGRVGTDIVFPDDPYLSPKHAELTIDESVIRVRDLGSRNGTWCFIDGAYRLQDGDLILIGSQIIRYRRLGYPGPNPPEADQTRRLGSLTPSADIACLTQLRSDGSSRDSIHLSPGRNVTIGRDQGDWLFSYDPSMSGLHAQIRSEDADFSIADAGSRNGVAITARGEMDLKDGSRFLLGDKLFKVTIS